MWVFFSSHIQLHGPHRNSRAGSNQSGSLPSKCNTGGRVGKALRCLQGGQCHGGHAAGQGKSGLRGSERAARSCQSGVTGKRGPKSPTCNVSMASHCHSPRELIMPLLLAVLLSSLAGALGLILQVWSPLHTCHHPQP